MAEPRNFPPLEDNQINDNTQGYTQSPGGALLDDQYSWEFQQILAYLKTKGVIVVIDGQYTSDAAAITSGGTVGDYYRVAPGHVDGYPSDGGIIKRIMS